MPRLFRQSPLNGVWEGSGNVICLDVLRSMERSPESTAALLAELRPAAEVSPTLQIALTQLQALLDRHATLRLQVNDDGAGGWTLEVPEPGAAQAVE